MSSIEVKKKYEDMLLKQSGVVGVGINGSIIIYVEKKTPQLLRMLPQTLDGVPVKIVEVGRITLQAIPVASAVFSDRIARRRPVVAGISIGHPEVTAGTLGCFVERGGELFGLSCNHVVALRWGELNIGEKGDDILQPGPADGGTQADKIGELEDWVDVKDGATIDAGIFHLTTDFKKYIEDVGVQSHSVEPYVGMIVKKSGRSTGLTYGRIMDVNATITVSAWGDVRFTDCIITAPPISVPGDSGSWVGDPNDRSVALVFAGSDKVSVLCKAINIEKELGVRFAGYLPYLSPIPPVAFGLTGMFMMMRR